MNVLTLASRLLFVTIYVAGALLLNYLLGIIDYGGLPSHLGMWAGMVTGGMVSGLLALALETGLYRRHGPWPRGLLPFMLRSILLSAVWISLGYAITAYLAGFQEILPPEAPPLSWWHDLATMPASILFMLPSAGIVAPFVGAATGLLLLNSGRRRRAPVVLAQAVALRAVITRSPEDSGSNGGAGRTIWP